MLSFLLSPPVSANRFCQLHIIVKNHLQNLPQYILHLQSHETVLPNKPRNANTLDTPNVSIKTTGFTDMQKPPQNRMAGKNVLKRHRNPLLYQTVNGMDGIRAKINTFFTCKFQQYFQHRISAWNKILNFSSSLSLNTSCKSHENTVYYWNMSCRKQAIVLLLKGG